MRHFSVSPHLPAAARRVLCGTLTAAVLLSGMAFAPISAQATGTPTEHYKFQASSSYVTDHEKLHSNLVWGKFSADDASTGTPQAQQSNAMGSYTGTLYAPDGAVSITSFGLSANVSTKSGGAVNNPLYHYGLPTRVYQTTTSAGYEKAIDENLTLTLADMNALDTTGLAAVNIAMIYSQNPTGSGTNVALDKQLQVFVSLDGETYLPDSVGIRSSSLIGGGVIASGSQGLFYHIETENLLDIEGVNAGDTIQSIKILPDGEYERTYGKFYISELCVNTYPTLADFDAASPKENILTTPVDEDTLRQIAVEEALRTAQTVWQTEQNFTASYSSTSRTYKAGYTFHGPVYERSTDAARELFWSLIAEDQYYTPDEMLQSHTLSSGTTNKFPYGMDCQTFVFNAISRVSRTNAWAVENTMGASRVSLLGDLEVVPHAAYTERDIIELNDEQALYENYAAAKAGDIAIHNMLDGSVHTRLIQSVTVKRSADGAINPSTSYMLCTEQAGTIRYYYQNTLTGSIGYVTNLDNIRSYHKVLYGTSSRVDEKYTFTSLRNGDYVAYTLDEYQRELVENVKVEVAPGSKTADKRFTEGGLNLAISSNYRIISYQVSLENRKSGETLFESELIYPINPNPWGVNYKDTELDAILAALPEGAYRINTVVDSGPFTSLDEDTVPQTVKTLDFLVSDEIQCPTDGHSPSLDWTPVTAAWIRRNCALRNNCYNLPAGNYYLAEDVTVPNNYSLEIPQKTTLCLNGHALTINGTKTNHSIYLSNGSTSRLSVFDCSGGGTIQAGDAAAQIGGTDGQGTYVFYLTPGSQLNMYAGTITNSYVRNGAVCLDGNETDTSMGAVMNMYGGSITGNTSPNDCGGIYAQYSSQFNLYDGTISNNTGAAKSSGVTAADGAAIHLLGGTISGNSGGSAGGVYLGKNSSLIMEGGTISGNSGTDASAVYLYGSDTSFTMNSGIITNHTDGSAPIRIGADSASVTVYDGAQIINNKGTIAGAALLSAAGTFTMEGGTISGNSVENADTTSTTYSPAGAVSLCSDATFTMKGGEISNNTSTVNAGAVSNKGTMTLSGGTIYSNTVTGAGAGGVYNAGTLTMTGGAISKNTDSADASGGGVYNEGTFTMSGGSIAENTTAAADSDGGAGVYNAPTGTFDMTGGTISKNLSGAAGGGVYNTNAFTMSNNAKITENTATTFGGGIANASNSTAEFYGTATVNTGAVISNNTATTYGGGISNSWILHMYGEVSGNTSGSYGGGIRSSKEAYIYDGALIQANTATTNGGGVYSTGTVTMSGGTISGNTRKGSVGKDVAVCNSTFIMNDGLIGDSSSATPGRLWVYSDKNKTSSATINGGTLLGPNGASGAGNSIFTVNGGKVEKISTNGTTANVDINLNGGFYTRVYEDTADKTAKVVYTIGEGVSFLPTGEDLWCYHLTEDLRYGSNMVLGETLDMNVYFKQEDLAVAPASALVYTGDDVGIAAEVICVEDNGTSLYCVALPGVAAKEMGKKLSVILLDEEGNYIASTTDSVKEYGERILNDETQSDAIKTMIVDMLNYGAAAQQYLAAEGEEVGTLANADIDDYQGLKTNVDDEFAAAQANWGKVSFAGTRAYHSANLTLENDVDFNLYFWVAQIGEDKSFTCTVNGVEQEPGTFEEMLDGELLYKVKISGLTVADLANTDVKITFRDLDGKKTITDSVYNYLVRNDGKSKWAQDGKDEFGLSKALMAFSTSASQYTAD